MRAARAHRQLEHRALNATRTRHIYLCDSPCNSAFSQAANPGTNYAAGYPSVLGSNIVYRYGASHWRPQAVHWDTSAIPLAKPINLCCHCRRDVSPPIQFLWRRVERLGGECEKREVLTVCTGRRIRPTLTRRLHTTVGSLARLRRQIVLRTAIGHPLQANQFVHFTTSGLFVSNFGTPNFPTSSSEEHKYHLPGAAGNSFAPSLVKDPATGKIVFLHNDEVR